MTAILTQGLSKRYGDALALDAMACTGFPLCIGALGMFRRRDLAAA